MRTSKRLKLFGVGVLVGLSMFLVGGLREPAHGLEPEPTAQLQPWLEDAEINTDLNLRLQYLAGMAVNFTRCPSIVRAAACPWRMATTQCSTRIVSPP